MIKVFQVFKKSIKIPKPYYTPELRSDFKQWNEKIVSLNGHVKDQKLFLPIEQKSKLALSNPKTILIQDIIGYSGLKKEPKNGNICLPEWFLNQKNSRIKELFLFNGQTKNLDFEIFRMNQSEDKKFELNLNYLQNNLKIGTPKRDNHKICDLEKKQPIQYLINGKSDFTMSSRKEREFIESEYTIEYLGEINKIEFLPISKIKSFKEIPFPVKTVDERKILK